MTMIVPLAMLIMSIILSYFISKWFGVPTLQLINWYYRETAVWFYEYFVEEISWCGTISVRSLSQIIQVSVMINLHQLIILFINLILTRSKFFFDKCMSPTYNAISSPQAKKSIIITTQPHHPLRIIITCIITVKWMRTYIWDGQWETYWHSQHSLSEMLSQKSNEWTKC